MFYHFCPLKVQGKALLRTVKGDLNLKWPSQRKETDLPLLKEVLSKGVFVKLGPGYIC